MYKYFRFVSGDVGIYEAVDRDCPRDDLRRSHKPDGSWLPKVGTKYPGAISFWTEEGVNKYLDSGLQEWHRSVVGEPLSVFCCGQMSEVLYQDSLQVIGTPDPEHVDKLAWDEYVQAKSRNKIVDKVVAYVMREKLGQNQILVFEHDKRWSEAGIQVPAGTVQLGEDIELALMRETEEESGLKDLRLVKKLDEYLMYRVPHMEFNRRHVYWLESLPDTPDQWTHVVQGQDEDQGMNFHFYWLSLDEASWKLVGSMGSSIVKKLGDKSCGHS